MNKRKMKCFTLIFLCANLLISCSPLQSKQKQTDSPTAVADQATKTIGTETMPPTETPTFTKTPHPTKTASAIPSLSATPSLTADLARWREYQNALASRFLQGKKGLCEWKLLGKDGQEVYLWAMCQVASSPEGAAMSAPAVIYLDKDGAIEKVEIPRDGEQYSEDVGELFPEALHEKILSHSIDTDQMWSHIQSRHEDPEPPVIVISGKELP